MVGPNPATGVVWVNATTVTCVIPANTQGSHDVILTNPDGQSDTWSSMNYQPGPSVTAVVPNTDDVAGGASVVVQGAGFETSALGVRVQFGTVWVGPLTATDANNITVTVPAEPTGRPGPVDVTVENIPTTLTGMLTDGFIYTDATNPPDITGIAPTSGPLAGGTTITVTGTNFWDNATGHPTLIQISNGAGWNDCTNYNYGGVPTTIVCDTPAGAGIGPWARAERRRIPRPRPSLTRIRRPR
jgi:hypothetical protein